MGERRECVTAACEGIGFAGSGHPIEGVRASRSLSAPLGALPSPGLEVPFTPSPGCSEVGDDGGHLRRNQVVEAHAHLINRVAFKMLARLPPNVELDDLKSAGVIGLIDAAEKYEPEKSTSFRAYARFASAGPW